MVKKMGVAIEDHGKPPLMLRSLDRALCERRGHWQNQLVGGGIVRWAQVGALPVCVKIRAQPAKRNINYAT